MIKKAYIYLRVSTIMQVDGMSLEGQLEEIKKYCLAFNVEIKDIYSDEGKSGKSIEGRPEFQRMLRDIKDKQEVDHVIVWKLSRFGRNAKDVLNSLELIQKSGVNLFSKVENLDSGDKYNMLMITLLSALAEMERENIIEQTGNGKRYTAIAGHWNGGQAPYGYSITGEKKKILVINPEEAEVVKYIFDLYVNTDLGYNGVTAKLNEEKIPPRQKHRLDRKAMQDNNPDDKVYLPVMEDWYTTIVKKIIDNPVVCGKLRWGNETTIHNENGGNTRKKNDNPIIVDGAHEAIISEELWLEAQKKRKETGKSFGRRDSNSSEVINTFNKIAKCPCCGSGMISHKEIYKKKNGEASVYYNYVCGYNNNHKNGKCKRNAIRAEYLEGSVVDEIRRFIRRPNVIDEISNYMGNKLDTTSIQNEITTAKKKLNDLARNEELQYNILSQIGVSSTYKNMKPEKVAENINKIIQQREELDDYILSKENELLAVEQDKLNYESIKMMIDNFDKVYPVLTKEQQKAIIQSLVKEVKLGYLDDTKKKVVPLSMTLKITGEQIEMLEKSDNLINCVKNDNSELSDSSVESIILMQKCGSEEKTQG